MSKKSFINQLSPVLFRDIDKEHFDPDLYPSHIILRVLEIRNYAKKPFDLFARRAAKVAVFTMLQYFNLLNNRPIGQVKYVLF